MASKERLKGITLTIGGDTTELSKALKKPNEEAAELQQKLNAVNQALKMDPTNVDLISQKQRLLAQSVDNTKSRLELLTQAQEEFKKSGKDIDSKEYIELEKQIAQANKKLKDLAKQQKEVSTQTGISAESLKNFGNKAKNAASKIEPLSKVAGGLLTAIVALVPATEELRADLSFLENNAQRAGVGIDTTTNAFDAFNQVTNETDSSIEAVSNLLQSGFTESNLQKAVEGLAGAYLSFPDTIKIESLADSLQETFATGKATGQFAELLDRLGYSAENFAVELSKCKTETDKQNLALEILAKNGLIDTYNAWKGNNEALIESRQANQDLQEAMADLAEVALPFVTEVTNLFASILGWLANLDPKIQIIIIAILAFVAALAPLLSMIGSLSIAASTLNVSMLPIVGTIGLIVAAVVAIIAIFLYWDEIIEFVKKQWGKFTEYIGKRWKTFTNSFKSFVSDVIDKFAEIPSHLYNIGKNIVTGLIKGMLSKASWLANQLKSWAKGIIGSLKSLFGIHSPSTVMADEIGKNSVAGVGKGIMDNRMLALGPLEQLQKDMVSTFDPTITSNVKKALSFSGEMTINMPIKIDLDGQPIYKNIVKRVTQSQGLKQSFKGA